MAWKFVEFKSDVQRLLVIEVDTAEELVVAIGKATDKGWKLNCEGRVPNSSLHGAWLTKEVQEELNLASP